MGEEKTSGIKIAVLLLASNLVLSVLTYSMLPDRVILHWGVGGVPDGYGSKLTGVLLMQLVQFLIFGMYLVIPRIDPEKKLTASTGYYSDLMNLVLAFFMFINILFITQNLGYQYNMTSIMMPAFGVLLFALGNIIGKAESNWFVGVRTPWTLSNEEVWRSTHKKATQLFKIWGAVSFLGVIYPVSGIWVLLSTILVSVVYLVAYSYREYQRLEG